MNPLAAKTMERALEAHERGEQTKAFILACAAGALEAHEVVMEECALVKIAKELFDRDS